MHPNNELPIIAQTLHPVSHAAAHVAIVAISTPAGLACYLAQACSPSVLPFFFVSSKAIKEPTSELLIIAQTLHEGVSEQLRCHPFQQ